MPYPPITALPVAPNRSQPTTFSVRGDAFLAALDPFRTEVNTLAGYLDTLALTTGSGSFTDGAAATPSMTFTSDTDTGIFRATTNSLGFSTAGIEFGRINASQNLFIGSSATIAGPGAQKIQTQGLTIGSASMIMGVFSTTSTQAPTLTFFKSAGATISDYTIVPTGVTLGYLDFRGSEGTTSVLSARIRTTVFGTPAVGDVRAGFLFQPGSGANAVATVLTVDATAITSTIPFLAAAGAAATPSYAFNSSQTTGLFRQAADSIGVAIAGAEGFRLSASGFLVGTGGLGFLTGVGRGGAVTQITSRTTGVTLNTPCGEITLFTAAGSATPASFVVTNSSMVAVDNVLLNIKSGATNVYTFSISGKAAGSFTVTFWTTGGTASDTPVISYELLKGANT